MYQEERLENILKFLEKNKRLCVEDICELNNVSRDTARRDLVSLEKKSQIIRTHGGAIIKDSKEEIKKYNERLKNHSQVKEKIAKFSLTLINENDVLFMDTSTTVQCLAEFLDDKKCTIITSSINIADVVTKYREVELHLLGGKLHHEHRFLYGSATMDMISNYFVDKAFIGALEISSAGITVINEEDAAVKRKMVEQSKKAIVLVDSSKRNKTGYFKICNLKEIDLIITEKEFDENLMKVLYENNVEVMIVN